MDCQSCKESRETVSRHVHEANLDRLERINKRWFLAWLITFLLFVGTNAAWIYYESQWEVFETTIEAEQIADGGGNNYAVGGDIYGTSEG